MLAAEGADEEAKRMDRSSGQTTEPVHEEPLAPAPAPQRPAKKKLTWREARRKRRKARRRGEELLAWVLVPVILFGLYWGVTATLDFFGTTPGQVWDQAMQVKAALEKKAQQNK